LNAPQSAQRRDGPIAGNDGDSREFPLTEREYRFITSLVYDRSGIVLGPNKVNMVYSRLSRRLREIGLQSFGAYCDLIQGPEGPEELGFLINAITTNLTRFFREPHHFEHLRREVMQLSAAAAKRGGKRLRIWSAGCSSGEEPYSIAMTVAEALPDLASWDARILATDLDTNMVATAQAGLYPPATMADLSKTVRVRFFERPPGERDGSGVVVDPIKRLITFKHLNLLGTWPIRGPFDAIFCRNVMIYFDGPTKATLVERFAQLLKPGGWLYIGHSESLLDNHGNLRLSGPTIYRKSL
jgi:chemotaxis protein methyltransferase CheR